MSAQPPLKFLHCANLYLDASLEGVQALDAEVAAVLRRATFSAFDRVIETAIDESCDFVVIAGNVYDSAGHSLRAQLRFAESLQRLTDRGIACYIAHGPADPLSAWEAAVPLPEGVPRFTADGGSVPFTREGEEVARLHGVSWASASARPSAAAQLGQSDGGPFAVAVAHRDLADDCSLADLESAGMDYWALGGAGGPAVLRHGAPWIVRAGAPQGRSAAEAGPRGCYVVTVGEDGAVDCRFVPTAAVIWFDEEVEVSDCATRDEVIDAAFTKREEVRALAQGTPALLNLRLTGRTPTVASLRRLDPEHDLAALMRDGEGERPDFVWLAAPALATGSTVDVAQRRQVEDLVGDFLRSVEGLRLADDPEAAIRTALAVHPEHRAVAAFLTELDRDDLLALLRDAEALGLELLLGEAR
ncbi:MAG: metallophosphoesterase family protein [Anaerolineae bacterium]